MKPPAAKMALREVPTPGPSPTPKPIALPPELFWRWQAFSWKRAAFEAEAAQTLTQIQARRQEFAAENTAILDAICAAVPAFDRTKNYTADDASHSVTAKE